MRRSSASADPYATPGAVMPALRPARRRTRRPATPLQPDPRLLRVLRQAALAGLALVLVWPAARGHSTWLGWLPLWLLGMPLVAWWSLLRFPLPRWPRRHVQARRLRRARPALRGPAGVA